MGTHGRTPQSVWDLATSQPATRCRGTHQQPRKDNKGRLSSRPLEGVVGSGKRVAARADLPCNHRLLSSGG